MLEASCARGEASHTSPGERHGAKISGDNTIPARNITPSFTGYGRQAVCGINCQLSKHDLQQVCFLTVFIFINIMTKTKFIWKKQKTNDVLLFFQLVCSLIYIAEDVVILFVVATCVMRDVLGPASSNHCN